MKIVTEDGTLEINRAVRMWRVFKTGFMDGWKQPSELTSGMTYESQPWNELYDTGANCGQWAGRVFNRKAM